MIRRFYAVCQVWSLSPNTVRLAVWEIQRGDWHHNLFTYLVLVSLELPEWVSSLWIFTRKIKRASMSGDKIDGEEDPSGSSSFSACCRCWAAAGVQHEVDGLCLVFRECGTTGVYVCIPHSLSTLPHTHSWESLSLCLYRSILSQQYKYTK